MKDCESSVAPIVKGDKFSRNQCAYNELEREHMASISYASVVDSLMYAKVSTRLDITFAVEVPGRYQNNLGTEHCKDARKVLRYLRGNKNY